MSCIKKYCVYAQRFLSHAFQLINSLLYYTYSMEDLIPNITDLCNWHLTYTDHKQAKSYFELCLSLIIEPMLDQCQILYVSA